MRRCPRKSGARKLIAKDKDRVLREAQERAQSIVTEASTAHAAMIDEHEIVRQAKRNAEIVLRDAEEKAQRIAAGADAYAAHVLNDLDDRLDHGAGLGEERASRRSPVRVRRSDQRRRLCRRAAGRCRSQVQARRLRCATQQTLRETAELESVHIT